MMMVSSAALLLLLLTNNGRQTVHSFAMIPQKTTTTRNVHLPRLCLPLRAKTTDDDDDDIIKKKSREEIVRAAARELAKARQAQLENDDDSLLDKFNPFTAGRRLRRSIDDALAGLNTLSKDRRSVYYLEDSNDILFSQRDPRWSTDKQQQDVLPEVLIIGATGAVGRLVVRRLLLQGSCRVRVLVRDLYSKTLNLLGTGVTYCQGDLSNSESLEYAVTDVDKIVFCAGAPRADEEDFKDKFKEYCQEHQLNRVIDELDINEKTEDLEWEQLDTILQVRAQLAEQVDCVGMQNLVRAYQNVRFADYGTSQAAKRSLFKMEEDFNLFAIDDGTIRDDKDNKEEDDLMNQQQEYFDEDDYYAALNAQYSQEDYEQDFADYTTEYDDDDDDDDAATATKQRQKSSSSSSNIQCRWIRNQFDHGVFVGRLPKTTTAAQSAIISSRLRSSREDPQDSGIDLSLGFAGFVVRLCSDGGTYEMFIRTKEYETDGREYVCEFSTSTKKIQDRGNKSKNKFATKRLAFENFKAIGGEDNNVEPFSGKDIRHVGFRFRTDRNEQSPIAPKDPNWIRFYLAVSYIKVYRSQPEPEFVYLSDGRIPPVVKNRMISHETKKLVLNEDDDDVLVDQATLSTLTKTKERSSEETYYKYRGEEILKNSGLSYAIVRVPGYNESPSGEASTIDLRGSNDKELAPVSRDEVAQVCVGALLNPNALNKSFYVGKILKKQQTGDPNAEDLSEKFAALPGDVIP